MSLKLSIISIILVLLQGAKDDPFAETRRKRIVDRQNEYQQRFRNMLISPARADVFADGGKTPDPAQRTYSDVMREKRLAQEGVGIMNFQVLPCVLYHVVMLAHFVKN